MQEQISLMIQLLYWKSENGIPVLTEEEQVFLSTITNNQPNYITVAANAMADTSVEIKTDKIPSYLKLTKITVNDNEIKSKFRRQVYIYYARK